METVHRLLLGHRKSIMVIPCHPLQPCKAVELLHVDIVHAWPDMLTLLYYVEYQVCRHAETSSASKPNAWLESCAVYIRHLTCI